MPVLNDKTLQVTTPSDTEIGLSRVFDAPRHLVWDAITKPELVSRWLLGPDGWSMPICDIDLQVGGKYRYVWRHPSKGDMGCGGVFREIEPPARLVNTEQFDNPWYAGEALVTQSLTEEDGRTTLLMIIRYESKEVRDQIIKSGMETGVAVSYDRLDKILAA